jgi:hypothetical protein
MTKDSTPQSIGDLTMEKKMIHSLPTPHTHDLPQAVVQAKNAALKGDIMPPIKIVIVNNNTTVEHSIIPRSILSLLNLRRLIQELMFQNVNT